MHATTVAIDLAKDVFERAFADTQGRMIERKRLSRYAFARGLANRPPLRVVMGERARSASIARCVRERPHMDVRA